MNFNFYQQQFQSALEKIHKQQLDDAGLASFCGTVMNSVALKLYKPEWSGGPQAPLDAPSRIFFSIWVNEHAVKENKLFYNIHALKLRQLPGYKIASREFAENFRTRFSPHAKDWSNVSIKFGPLTLMQGWRELKNESISNDIFELTAAFLTISPLIDATFEPIQNSIAQEAISTVDVINSNSSHCLSTWLRQAQPDRCGIT